MRAQTDRQTDTQTDLIDDYCNPPLHMRMRVGVHINEVPLYRVCETVDLLCHII